MVWCTWQWAFLQIFVALFKWWKSTGVISSLDFNAEGSKIGLIEDDGKVIISSIDNDELLCEKRTTGNECNWFWMSALFKTQILSLAWTNKCRWNPISASPLIAVKYSQGRLTIADFEKTAFNGQTLRESLRLPKGMINFVNFSNWFYIDPFSIDWRCDGNLLLLGDYDHQPKIYDQREGKIVKIFENVGDSKCLIT